MKLVLVIFPPLTMCDVVFSVVAFMVPVVALADDSAPLNVPVVPLNDPPVTLMAYEPERRAAGTVPVDNCDALKPVNPLAFPLSVPANVTLP
jgi:hypothetical protein